MTTVFAHTRSLFVSLALLIALLSASSARADEWVPGPEASGPSQVVGFIETPRPGGLPGTSALTIQGWVVDRSAEGWTGITEIHVYAGEAGNGTFLGTAQVHRPRPDVAAALGNPYWTASGFTLGVRSTAIPAGTPRLTVYARTPDRGWWSLHVPLTATAAPPPPVLATSASSLPTAPTVQLSSEQTAFIDQVGAVARRWRGEIGLAPSLVTAIAINESGWGKSRLAVDAHNYFGIKAHRGLGTAGSVSYETWEVVNGETITITASFRAYYTLEESVRDLGTFLHTASRYQPVWAVGNNPEAAARALLQAGYATDPAWADKLIRIMRTYGLGRLD